MQVKKFEAPTIQEALDNVKRELGPEAIILQTKKSKRGFGIMAKASVEVTAAVSERSLGKKQAVEIRIPEASKEIIKKYSAEKQVKVFDQFADRQLEQASHMKDQVSVKDKSKRITATRYIDIEEGPSAKGGSSSTDLGAVLGAAIGSVLGTSPAKQTTKAVPTGTLVNPTSQRTGPPLEDEVRQLKRMIQELKSAQDEMGRTAMEGASAKSREGGRTFLNQISLDNPLLQDAFEQLVVNGMDRRYALSLIK
ncbi:MAG: hypothetical protein ABIQ95_17500, partial [Bdellovibrionia bacterium]